jgi:hypothetical protein
MTRLKRSQRSIAVAAAVAVNVQDQQIASATCGNPNICLRHGLPPSLDACEISGGIEDAILRRWLFALGPHRKYWNAALGQAAGGMIKLRHCASPGH